MWIRGSQARVGAVQLWEFIWHHSESRSWSEALCEFTAFSPAHDTRAANAGFVIIWIGISRGLTDDLS